MEQELSDELRFHLKELTGEKLARGMTPQEARYAALRELAAWSKSKRIAAICDA
jgi:hypothetical protein